MMLRHSVREKAVAAAILLAVWWVLSGKFDVLHFGTGVVTALVLGALYAGVSDACSLPPAAVPAVRIVADWADHIVEPAGRADRAEPADADPPAVHQPGAGGARRAGADDAGQQHDADAGHADHRRQQDEIFVHALDEKSALDTREQIIARHVARVFDRRRT
jgi:hypothetical protein